MSWHRSGDPLMKAVAGAFKDRAIGTVLSGLGRNGEVGLVDVKNAGGMALVQDPGDAQFPSMPQHALDCVSPDFQGSAADIALHLAKLCRPAHPSA